MISNEKIGMKKVSFILRNGTNGSNYYQKNVFDFLEQVSNLSLLMCYVCISK